MSLLEHTDVIAIMERTLNHIDGRLINHGRRVAYTVYKLLWPTGRYTAKEMQDICIIALLHDIGAYKTEEIDRMVSFETEETIEHAVYGYLFLKYFSPVRHLARAILYHHTPCTKLDRDDPMMELSQVIFLADRLDVYALGGIDSKERLHELLRKQSGTLFFPDLVDFVIESDLELPVRDEQVAGESSEISRVLHSIPLTDQETTSYLKMIVLFIDLRSHQTLTHTIATTSISNSLAKLMGVDDASRGNLIAGSWLHDIGKTGVPLKILEKPTRLTNEEMAVVQAHVSLTSKILDGNVREEVRRIASHHHEKLDGSGYPDGLDAAQLTVCERIAVVADIFSALCGVRSYKNAFPRAEVVRILIAMKGEGLLDPAITDAAIVHYDEIMDNAEKDIRPFEQSFQIIQEDFEMLSEELEELEGV